MNLDELDYPVPDPTWDYATPTLPSTTGERSHP